MIFLIHAYSIPFCCRTTFPCYRRRSGASSHPSSREGLRPGKLYRLSNETSWRARFFNILCPLKNFIHHWIFSTGQGPSVLSPGIHSFPFKLGLPLGLPSTFLGKHGWVQYFCKTALREPNGLTHKNQQVFIVMNPIDLNLEPSILGVSLKNWLWSFPFSNLSLSFLFFSLSTWSNLEHFGTGIVSMRSRA